MAVSKPFEVYEWSIETLLQLLAKLSDTPPASVEQKSQFGYLDEYFEECSAKTIVVEYDYVDHDYLEDYAAYYAKCFHKYERFCSRLHFFSLQFAEADFSAIIRGDPGAVTKEGIEKSYLGFSVIKPLPSAFLGRTCLITYPLHQNRHYPTTRMYDANLFGIGLQVDAVAFQEQDRAVSACATSALWSAFQGTGMLFHHPIPSPVEITRAATRNSDDRMRSLPNDGLTLEQIARAVREVTLEPYLVEASDPHVLKTTAYAYLKGHIPLLMDFQLVEIDAHPFDGDDGETPQVPDDVVETACSTFRTLRGTQMGSHEVAVVGYCLGGQVVPLQDSGIRLTATRIDKLYVHDDQIGPYARMHIDNRGFLSTNWKGELSGIQGTVWAAPGHLLAPLYNKIRIPFGTIHDMIGYLDSLIEALRTDSVLPFGNRLEWDVHLIASRDLKTEVLKNSTIGGDDRERILLKPMPRFLWRALAKCDVDPIADWLFDATDIETGVVFFHAIDYSPDFRGAMQGLANNDSVIHQLQGNKALSVLDWYKSSSEIETSSTLEN